MQTRMLTAFLISATIAVSADTRAQENAVSRNSEFQSSVVAADHWAASAAGASILKQGGNAVDAAVATSFALSVVRPASCGLGGGGFMVIWDAESRKAVALDYRERAPAAADRSMYVKLDQQGAAESASVRGASAAGIPGNVAGLCHAATKWGTLPIKTLIEPALQLCRDGVPVDEHDMEVQASVLEKLHENPDYKIRFELLLKQYLNDGTPWKKGDRFFSPQRPVLELIAEHGASGFYAGPVAESLIRLMQQDGGFITAQDLKSQIPAERAVLQGSFHQDTVITMPPPSSGGIALLQTLGALEHWEQQNGRTLRQLGHNSADYVHTVTEAMKHAFADRAEYLGDTDFVSVPVDRLLSDPYADSIARKIQPESTLPAEAYGRFFAASDGGTSHFSVIDAAGNAVACTETINLTFGSFAVVPGYGIILNNQMDDFSAKPGEPNAFGLMQSAANAVEPGKKPLSSMTPTIIIRDGKAVYACGASGGPRIISATLQSLLNFEVFGMSPQQAVSASRFHHQWFPNELLIERSVDQNTVQTLQSKGHTVRGSSSLAAAQAAGKTAGGLMGGSDPRKHGIPAGN